MSEVNVLSYGADPTGSSNSTSAFNSAASAAGSGGTVFMPVGTYKLTPAFNMSGRRWRGEYASTTSGQYTKLIPSASATGGFVWSSTKCEMRDFVVDCQDSVEIGVGIAGSGSVLHNVGSGNCTVAAFSLAGQVCRASWLNAGGSPVGFLVQGANASRFADFVASSCGIALKAEGVFFNSSLAGGEFSLRGLLAQSCTDEAVWIRGCQRAHVWDIYAEPSAGGTQIRLSDTALACHVSDALISGSSGAGAEPSVELNGARLCNVHDIFVAGDDDFRKVRDVSGSANLIERCYRLSHTVSEALTLVTT